MLIVLSPINIIFSGYIYKGTILSHVRVTYKTVFGLDNWMFAPFTFTQFGTTDNTALSLLYTFSVYRAAYALRFPGLTSRILATDLSWSHSHFKSSRHSLIPFLPFLLNHLRLSSPELDPVLLQLLFCTPFSSAFTSPPLPNTSYKQFARTPRKEPSKT
jgi:hypothetical protein